MSEERIAVEVTIDDDLGLPAASYNTETRRFTFIFGTDESSIVITMHARHAEALANIVCGNLVMEQTGWKVPEKTSCNPGGEKA